MSKASPHKVIKLQKLLLHNVRTAHELLSPGWKPRNHYCEWFPDSLANGFFKLQLVSFLDEAWFTLSENLNRQTGR